MKKFLLIAVAVLAVGFLAIYGYAKLQVGENNDTLAEIKSAPGVVVLQVDGMT